LGAVRYGTADEGRARRVRLGAVLLALALLTLGEWRLFDRVLFADGGVNPRAGAGFVLTAVDGVRAGRPVSPSWQQRLVGPALVAAIAGVTGGDRLRALVGFTHAMVLAANLLAFVLSRAQRRDDVAALGVVVLLGLARALTLYRLEYPWDEIDVLIFLAFGAWARRGRPLWPLWPLLVLGTLNHETILYVPLWYLLLPSRRRELVSGLVAVVAMAGAIAWLRARLYVGPPLLAGQALETPLPLVDNHWHVAHNLGQWLVEDWRAGRAFISATLTAAVLLLLGRLKRHAQSSLWTLGVLASIVCFGYVNETRHYLVPIAFWVTYAL
jgi:hypothetical protein